MINSVGMNSNYVQYCKPVFTSQAQNHIAVNNVQSDTPKETTNLIMQYLENQARNNVSSPYNVSTPIWTHAFGNCDNMKVTDAQGNVVQNVEFKKDGDKLTEEIFVKCVNGSTVNKTIVNDGNKKSMTLIFKNKNGEITGQENRTYEKLDDNTAISVHNGKTYKISGLSGDVITVEHDGQKKVIDLGKKIQPTLDTIENKPTNKQISLEQKEFLLNSVKKLSGDLILKFDEEIDQMVILDTDEYEGFYRNDNGIRKLKLSQKVKDDMTFCHELGHAINRIDSEGDSENKVRISDNKNYIKTREIEMNNFRNRCKNDDIIKPMNKFIYDDFIQKGYMSYEEGQKDGQDEEFAEMTGFINCMDVDWINNRVACMLQFMPESTQMVYKKNQELF